jgi:hypothetical protein
MAPSVRGPGAVTGARAQSVVLNFVFQRWLVPGSVTSSRHSPGERTAATETKLEETASVPSGLASHCSGVGDVEENQAAGMFAHSFPRAVIAESTLPPACPPGQTHGALTCSCPEC